MTIKQFFTNPITIIVGILVLLGLFSLAYNKLGWFGGAKSRSKKINPNAKGMGGVCAGTDESPSWLFGCYFAYQRQREKEQKLIDACVNNLIAQDPEGDFPVEGLKLQCEEQIRGGTHSSWQTGDPESLRPDDCSCGGSRHWLFGCLRCRWS